MERTFAEQYGALERWHWWFRGRRSVIESVLRHELQEGESRRVLSVGCGPAAGLDWLLPFAGPHGRVVGLDAEPLHARDAPRGVEFVTGRLEAAPFAPASFELVLALDVLEHLDDDAAGLGAAARLVKPGGLLLATVPALPSLWGGQDVVSAHRRRYTRRALARLCRAAGLPACEIRYFNTLLFPLVGLIRWSRRALGLAGRARSDFEDTRPGALNELLGRVFSLEGHLINRVPAPVGVSLLVKYKG